MKSKNLLLIFTRNPELGKVKSRLAKSIGATKALAIYKSLLNYTCKITVDLAVAKRVYYSEEIWKDDVWNSDEFEKKIQKGFDLGAKMANAFSEGFADGFENIVIIGSDCDTITSTIILDAFAALDNTDAVIGPAEDGGYYLLGMKKNTPAVFKNKSWGEASVLSDTLEDLKEFSLEQLPLLNDVDVISDIKSDSFLSKLI